MYSEIIRENLQNSIKVKNHILSDTASISAIASIAEAIIFVLRNGGKLLICGNGGSAADAMHFAGELVGRFQKERKGLAAISLNADVATITSISNDYGYSSIFSRQIEGLMTAKDILLGISTSGNSDNIYNAFMTAKKIGGKTALLTGIDGGKSKDLADLVVYSPSNNPAFIQESHVCIYHTLSKIIEDEMVGFDV